MTKAGQMEETHAPARSLLLRAAMAEAVEKKAVVIANSEASNGPSACPLARVFGTIYQIETQKRCFDMHGSLERN